MGVNDVGPAVDDDPSIRDTPATTDLGASTVATPGRAGRRILTSGTIAIGDAVEPRTEPWAQVRSVQARSAQVAPSASVLL